MDKWANNSKNFKGWETVVRTYAENINTTDSCTSDVWKDTLAYEEFITGC